MKIISIALTLLILVGGLAIVSSKLFYSPYRALVSHAHAWVLLRSRDGSILNCGRYKAQRMGADGESACAISSLKTCHALGGKIVLNPLSIACIIDGVGDMTLAEIEGADPSSGG